MSILGEEAASRPFVEVGKAVSAFPARIASYTSSDIQMSLK